MIDTQLCSDPSVPFHARGGATALDETASRGRALSADGRRLPENALNERNRLIPHTPSLSLLFKKSLFAGNITFIDIVIELAKNSLCIKIL